MKQTKQVCYSDCCWSEVYTGERGEDRCYACGNVCDLLTELETEALKSLPSSKPPKNWRPNDLGM